MTSHPTLDEISLVGHSMGGLIARYAAGRLFDPGTGLIAGRLVPVHYVALASPHLGCDVVAGPSQLPLVAWLGFVPIVGGALGHVLERFVPAFSRVHLRQSGRQFFLADREIGMEPLIWRLSQDESSAPYFAALAAFQTRTLYANIDGDHLVGWSNASLRALQELPEVSERVPRCGVVREDSLVCAWDERMAPPSQLLEEEWRRSNDCGCEYEQHASERAWSQEREKLGGEPELRMEGQGAKGSQQAFSGFASHTIPADTNRANPTNTTSTDHQQQNAGTAGFIQTSTATTDAKGTTVSVLPNPAPLRTATKNAALLSAKDTLAAEDRAELAESILCTLRTLRWRRVDVSFAHCLLPLLAHQHIQVQRPWLNGAGKNVARHLARTLQTMERARRRHSAQCAAMSSQGTMPL